MHGTRGEWDTLTVEEQSSEWDSFHEANATGTADRLYFYEVMMCDYLDGYVGD